MEKCGGCKIEYPEDLLFFSGDRLCGICVLDVINDTLDGKKKQLVGDTAEKRRLEAIEWRKKHNK